MKTVMLTEKEWTVCGWRKNHWRMTKGMEIDNVFQPEIMPVKTKVPSSVQNALLENGKIADWNRGRNSLQSEWAENRHWEFRLSLPGDISSNDETILLIAEGLDYSGWILIDDKEVGTFCGTLIPHGFDLSGYLKDGKEHYLRIIFDTPVDEQGQIGYSSLSKYFKPRFNYEWDWCVRFVPIGIWDNIYLKLGTNISDVKRTRGFLKEDLQSAEIVVDIESKKKNWLSFTLKTDKGNEILSEEKQVEEGERTIQLNAENIIPWYPNGYGEQTLYNFTVSEKTSDGVNIIKNINIGFKQIEWKKCKNAPKDAEPWLLSVNGEQVFLQGVNWTPIKMDYHSIKDSEYEDRVSLYKDMGVTILRIWGGGILEKEIFYNLCDQAGIFVWQEFPLSSSGIDNDAPYGEDVIKNLTEIAKSYIERRGYHVSKLLWCGGNELQTPAAGGKIQPSDYTHPCIKALKETVERYDKNTRFIPTSSSGPAFLAKEKNYGKGIHHDVHGPWGVRGTLEDWQRYWENDDALFRSEVGVPASASLQSLKKYLGNEKIFPPDMSNPYYRHTCPWWLCWADYEDLEEIKNVSDENEKMRIFVEKNQVFQAKAYAIAASACKSRFPECGGFIVWMGHDSFACPVNNSIIEYDGAPKKAYYMLKDVFQKPAGK